MANKKKNSNYVTDKTNAAKQIKAEEDRRKKTMRIVKPIVIGVAALLAIVGIVFAIGVPLGMLDYDPKATEHISITIEGYESGHIDIELYGDDAPKTVDHFIKHMHDLEGMKLHTFKDGLLFFGKPAPNSGSDSVKGEFTENGFENNISIRRGVIAVSIDESAPDKGGMQFFIATEDATELNGKRAAFARITSGMSIIDEILDSIKYDENGYIENPPVIKSISESDGHSH